MDPKTGKVADYDPHGKPEIANEPEKKEDHVLNQAFKAQFDAREEIAKRRQSERTLDEGSQAFDVLNEDGSITPAKKPIAAAVEEALSQEPETKIEAEELAQEGDVPRETTEEPVEAKVEPERAPEPEEERELIVDGNHIKVPLSKILDAGTRALQKESAADARLAAATQLLQQAQERAKQAPQSPAEPQERREPSQEPDDAALARAIQFGTEAEAAAALKALRGQGRPTDPRATVDFIRNTLMVQLPQQVAFQNANEWVRGEYKEIFSDPDLQQLFMQKESRLRQEGDQRPFKELYKGIADDLVTKFKLRDTETLQTRNDTSKEPADRLTRKIAAPKVITGAGGKQAAPAEQKPETLTQYIERTRRARGLQPQQRS